MSSMEPSLQPSFKFPNRHQTANYAKGLLEQSAISQLLLIRPKRNTDIDTITSLQTPLTVPPTLDKDVFDVKPVLPVVTPIYVQPGLAEGMTNLAQYTNANTTIIQITSANNALKRGNYRSAENILGRQLTQEEIGNRTITPNIRTSESNPASAVHLDEEQKMLGMRVGETKANYQQRLQEFKGANAQLINDIAIHLNIPANQVRELKTAFGFTGDSILGYVKGDKEHRKSVLNTFLHLYQSTKGMHPDTRAEVLRDRSILEGENQPIHSGKKARAEQRKYEENVRRNAREHPQGPFAGEQVSAEDLINQEPSDPAVPFDEEEVPDAPDQQFQGMPPSIGEQLSMPESWYERKLDEDEKMAESMGPQPGQGKPITNPQTRENVQENIRMPKTLQEQIKEAAANLKKGGRQPTVSAPAEPDMFARIQDRMDLIRMANAGSDDESEFEDYKDSGTKMKVDLLQNADVYEEPVQDILMAKAGLEREKKYVSDPEAAYAKRFLFTEDSDIQKRALEVAKNTGFSDKAFSDLQNIYLKRERREALDEDEVAYMHEFIRQLGYYRRDQREDAYAEVDDHTKRRRGETYERGEPGKRKRNNNVLEGGSLSTKRRRRSMKHQHLEPRANEQQWLPETDSFSPYGGVLSGNLMRRTGYDAVPLSAQIQVQNTHQYRETPLVQWVKNPHAETVDKPEIIPIAQQLRPKRTSTPGVGRRARKVQFGGYLVDHHKLLTDNVLSLSHPSGKKVKGFPNREISEGLKDAIHQVLTGGKVNSRKLSPADKLRLKDLLSRSAADVDVGGDVNVTPTKQLQLIMGEMSAGNDAPELKKQLKKLLPILVKGGNISKEQATNIREHYC